MQDTLAAGARVALPTNFMGFVRILVAENRTAWTPDGSSLQFLVEEYVALGASEIVVDAHAIIAPAVEHLPASLKERVVIADQDKTLRRTLNAFMEPMTEEFGFRFDWPGGWERSAALDIDATFQNAVFPFQEALYSLFLGSKYCAEVEVKLDEFISLTDTLRMNCRNPEMRTRLAALKGLLSTYSPVSFDAARVISTAPNQLVTLFEQLTEDATYQYLSREARFFGIPLKCRRAAGRVSRLARELVGHTAFRSALTLGSAGLAAATGASVSSSEVVEMLGSKPFLPPLLSLRVAVAKAEAMWKRMNPDYLALLKKDRRDMTALPAGETVSLAAARRK